jgi:porin
MKSIEGHLAHCLREWLAVMSILVMPVMGAGMAQAADEAARARPDAATEPPVSLAISYKFDLLRANGGADPASGAMGNIDFKMRADLDALWGWKNSVAYIQAIGDHGSKLNGNHIGSLMGVSNIEVPTNTTKLFHAWLQRNFLDDRLSLLAGLYPIDSEFSVMDSAGVLLHPSFGAPADLALTRGPSIFNTSALGVRLRWDSAERDRYAMLALLDGVPGDPGDPHGTHVRFDSGDGVFSIAEVGWMPPERGHTFEPTDPSSPQVQGADIRLHEKYESFGKYALGLWSYSERVGDLVDLDHSGRPVRRPSHGGYLMAEATLYREPGSVVRQLAGFARLSFTDGDSTAIHQALNLGLRCRMPFPDREDDIVALGYSQARLSGKYRELQALSGIDTARAEHAWELTYKAKWNDWLALQPVVQRVFHVGGEQGRNATVLGLRVEANSL